MGLVFGVDEIGRLLPRPQSRAGHQRSVDGARNRPCRNRRASWQNMVWPEDAARGIFSFAIRHDDPDALKPAPVTGGPVRGRPCGCANLDIDASKTFYGTQLGIGWRWNNRGPIGVATCFFPHQPYEHRGYWIVKI